MPTHVVVQVAEKREQSNLARDLIVNTPCFRWSNLTIQDAESLANNVLDAYDAIWSGVNQGEYTAKVYDLEGTQPVLPMATVVRHPGQIAPATVPREISLVLSFSGGQHQPRQRGRLYILADKLIDNPLGRPSTIQQQSLIDFGQQLYAVGGANVDWIVWSRVNKSATGVTRVSCDDEWDTTRTRGLKATNRLVHNF